MNNQLNEVNEAPTLSLVFDDIKGEVGVDVSDYVSLKDFFFAYYSTFDTAVLEEYSRSSINDPNETLEAVLSDRRQEG